MFTNFSRRDSLKYSLFLFLQMTLFAQKKVPLHSNIQNALSPAIKDSMIKLFSTEQFQESSKIKLNIAEIAEDGKVIPIKITSSIENIHSIAIYVKENKQVLASYFYDINLAKRAFLTRIRSQNSSHILVIVSNQNGKLYGKSQYVRVAHLCSGTG